MSPEVRGEKKSSGGGESVFGGKTESRPTQGGKRVWKP